MARRRNTMDELGNMFNHNPTLFSEKQEGLEKLTVEEHKRLSTGAKIFITTAMTVSTLGTQILTPITNLYNQLMRNGKTTQISEILKQGKGLTGCQGGSGGTINPDPIVYEDISATFEHPVFTRINGDSAGAIPGAKIRLIGNGKDITIKPGEKADLGQIEKGKTVDVDITITGNNAYTAKCTYAMSGNMNFGPADLADKRIVEIDKLMRITPTGKNERYDRTSLELSFNPDPATGKRLPDNYIDKIIDGYNAIKSRARGKLSSINIIKHGNKAYAQPNDGEGRVFRYSDGNGVNTAEYVSGGAVVSFVFNCDTNSASSFTAKHETLDTVLGGNVSVTIDSVLDEIEFRFARPLEATFFSTHELRSSYPGNVSSAQGALSTSAYAPDNTGGMTSKIPGAKQTPYDKPHRGMGKIAEQEQQRKDYRGFVEKR